jgi:hypothetical protein
MDDPNLARAYHAARSYALVESIENELALGTKHFDKNKNLLATTQEIVDYLKTGGEISVEPTAERQHEFEKPTVEKGGRKPYIIRGKGD